MPDPNIVLGLANDKNAGAIPRLEGAGQLLTSGDGVTPSWSDDTTVPTGEGVEVGAKFEWNGSVWIQKRGWITIDLRNSTATTPVAAATNAALNTRDGVCVEYTDGVGAWEDTIVFNRSGSTLCGQSDFGTPFHIFNNGYVDSGTTMNIKHTGKAVRVEQPNCRLRGVEHYYADQNHNPSYLTCNTDVPGQWNESSPGAHDGVQAYDYTWYVQNYAHGFVVEKCVVHGAYMLYYFSPNQGVLRDIKAMVLRRGVYFPRCGAAPHCDNVQLNPLGDYLDLGGMAAWAKANGTAFLLDGVEGYFMNNCNAFGFAKAIDIYDLDNDGFTGLYGTWMAPDFEGCTTIICVRNDSRTYQPLANIGGKFIGGQFVPEIGGTGIDLQDTAVPANVNNYPGIALIGTTMHSSPAGMAYAVHAHSGSYGRVKWTDATATQVATALAYNESPAGQARIKMWRVDRTSGIVSRLGPGDISDNDYDYL